MSFGTRATWMFAAALCASACAGAAGDAPAGSADLALQDEDWSKTWRQLAAPSISQNEVVVAGAPGGWIAVSTRDQDGSKNPPAPDSVAYFSKDGTHWHAILTPGDYPLQGASVAYGGGRYVITGSRAKITGSGAETVVLDSTDGETWHEQSLDGPTFAFYNGPVTYAGDRFFYVSGKFWGSLNGDHWAALPHDYPFAMLEQIAYGNGVYLGVGVQTQLSSDGAEWHAVPLDCALPIDCYADPEGNVEPEPLRGVFFAEGRFYAQQWTSVPEGGLTSSDGESWQFVRGPFPDAYVAGRFARFFGAQPAVWLPGDNTPRSIEVSSGPGPATAQFATPPPTDVDLSWSDDVDCTNARCLIIHSRLFLVP
jgi:hypothetical protein